MFRPYPGLREVFIRINVTPLRYDYDENLHQQPVHPISHLHLGFENEIRVPLMYILTPHAFVSFVIRHIYWNKWKNLISDSNFCSIYYVKNQCEILHEKHFGLDEKKDFYIA